ncbi:MAG: hypothetical protein WAN89_06110 [Lawsonella sp.]|nr:hypothetical protein [Mycobacteriales bacterium]
MNRGPSAILRILTFLAGAVLTAVGVLGILWHANVASVSNVVDNHWPSAVLEDVTAQSWWIHALIGTAVVAILLIILNIVVLTRRRTVSPLLLDGDDPKGQIFLDTALVGRAVARDLENLPTVRDAASKTINDNGVPTVNVTLTSPAHVPVPTLLDIAEQVSADIPAAVSYCGPVARVFLELDRVRRQEKDLPSRDSETAGVSDKDTVSEDPVSDSE